MARRRKLTAEKAAPVDPLIKAIAAPLIEWLESASMGALCEDMEIVPAHDRGEPADPYLAVHIAIEAREKPARRIEIVIAIEASEKQWLPDSEDELLEDLHQRIAMPIDARCEGPDAEPFSDVLAALEAAGVVISGLRDIKRPTLFPVVPGSDRLAYSGILQSSLGDSLSNRDLL